MGAAGAVWPLVVALLEFRSHAREKPAMAARQEPRPTSVGIGDGGSAGASACQCGHRRWRLGGSLGLPVWASVGSLLYE
jgi:hypothetical protein